MTVCDRRILQKHNFGSESPIQYLPLSSCHAVGIASIWTSAGSLFTTAPTATSSLFFGFATYDRRGGFGRSLATETERFGRGVPATEPGSEPRGGRDGGRIVGGFDPMVEGVGDGALEAGALDILRGRGIVSGVAGTGGTEVPVVLFVRCLDEYVDE